MRGKRWPPQWAGAVLTGIRAFDPKGKLAIGKPQRWPVELAGKIVAQGSLYSLAALPP
jgi:hypothetical protein